MVRRLLKHGGMMTRAATLAAALSLLLASSAFAGTASRSFMVGAVVVRSATVAAVVNATANEGVHVQQIASRGTPAPMVLVAGNLEPVSQSRPIKLAAGSNGDMTVTLFY